MRSRPEGNCPCRRRRTRLRLFAALALCGSLFGCGDSAAPQGGADIQRVSAGSFILNTSTVSWSPDTSSIPALAGSDLDRALLEARTVPAPPAYRATVPFSPDGWLVAELYSRSAEPQVTDFLSLAPDPDDPSRQVIRLSTRKHTDGVILRSRDPLPEAYRISLRIGHIRYGGSGPLNGYDSGDETGEPWMRIPATGHNGVYWATIMDTLPQPRENIWAHHHRKFFIDAWNYRKRMLGVTVAAVDGRSTTDPRVGKAFHAHDGHDWKPYSVEPAFFYRPDRWYAVTIERSGGSFRYAVEGDFHGVGFHRFEDAIDIEESCVYHYNRSPGELDAECLLGDVLDTGAGLAEVWPADSAYPDYFMMGDPHINFYEGEVLVDLLSLETL